MCCADLSACAYLSWKDSSEFPGLKALCPLQGQLIESGRQVFCITCKVPYVTLLAFPCNAPEEQ